VAELPVDRYTLRARIAPGLIAVLPILLVVVAWSAPSLSLLKSAGWTVIVGLLSLLGAQFVRDAGAAREASLFARWDGAPTTRFLRHRDTTLDPVTKQRYHTRLGELLEGLHLPAPQDESNDPSACDLLYQSCVAHLRERTRDKQQFPLINEANIDYGFRRNLWAIKPFGVSLALVGTATAYVLGPGETVPMLCVAAGAILSFWWGAGIREGWVAVAADSYAKALLAACEVLQPESRERKSPPPQGASPGKGS